LNVKIADNYDSAIKIALNLLKDHQKNGSDGHEMADSGPPALYSYRSSTGSIQHPDWHLQFDNFSLRFEVIAGKALHGISTGRLENDYIEPSLNLQEKVTKSAGLPVGAYYYVLGLKDSEGAGQKARKQYADAILKLYKKNPFRMFVFYGVSRLLKGGINLAKPLIPFKVRIVDNLDLALALIAEDETKQSRTRDFPGIKNSIPKKYKRNISVMCFKVASICLC
jgi:hypothetical protein